MIRARLGAGWFLVPACALAGACHAGKNDGRSAEHAADVLAALRANPASPLGPALAGAFQPVAGGYSPQFSPAGEPVSARVVLPARASGATHLEDSATGFGVDVALVNASATAAEISGGYLVYPHGHGSGASLVHRALPSGTEDYLSFDVAPAVPEVDYDLTLGKSVAGLRLVAGTLEMLDAKGAPRLRVAPPYLVGADGARTDATLAVAGCAVDTNPAAPWGRAVTSPGAASCAVRVTWPAAAVVYPAVLDPRWTATGSMTTTRQGHTATLLSTGNVLVVGGTSNGTTALATAELYNRTTGTWGTTNPMTGARTLHSATQLPTSSNSATSGRVLIAGGLNGTTSQNTAQLYAPSTGIWTAAGTLNAARHGHTATLLVDGRVLVTGGLNGTTTLNTAALYNPATGSGTWTAAAGTMASALKNHAAALLTTSNNQLSNKVLVFGGNNGTATVSVVYLFDPTQNAFSTQTSLPSAREGHTVTVLANGNLLVTGGKSGTTTLNTTVLFNPTTGTGSWTSAGTMTAARQAHSATLIPSALVSNGQVLVAGGSSGSATLTSAELWNGTTTWTATSALLSAQQGHTATLLGNDAILIAGGVSGTATLSTSQLYDASFGLACTTNTQCVTGFCVNGVCCDTACNGGCGACNLAGKVGTCSAVASGTVCRASTGTCDVAETCNGTVLTCPADAKAANGTTCNDNNACTTGETCQSGTCGGGTAVTCTGADTCHTVGACVPATGCPAPAAKANGTTCNDNNACTTGETCQSGTCGSGTTVTCTADTCHTVGACVPATGCPTPVAKANGTTCNDNNACTTGETCQSGACGGGTAVTCTGADTCHTVAACVPATGCPAPVAKANGTTCNDNNACTTGETCQSGTCGSGTTVTCTGADTCHTVAACVPATGCPAPVAKANGTTCNDNNACTTGETCQSGTCSGGTAVTCTADTCHTVGACVPATGCPAPVAKANGTTCNDNNACTTGETCQSGTCGSGTTVTCTGADTCHTVGACVPATGCPAPVTVANGTACNDSNACTTGETCQSGTCAGGTTVTCTADTCHTVGACVPATGCPAPVAKANGTTCNDNNACTTGETCQSGTCGSGTTVTCTGGDTCHTVGACAPATGCPTPAVVANGTLCNDNNVCTTGETCQTGTCTGGTAINCAAPDQCHTGTGTCDPVTGCAGLVAVANGTPCNDSNACTQSDTCQAGACVGGNPIQCAPSDGCHAPSTCDPTSGTCRAGAVLSGSCQLGVFDYDKAGRLIHDRGSLMTYDGYDQLRTVTPNEAGPIPSNIAVEEIGNIDGSFANAFPTARAINAKAHVTGWATLPSGATHTYMYVGSGDSIDVNDAANIQTELDGFGITSNDTVGGGYFDGVGVQHLFTYSQAQGFKDLGVGPSGTLVQPQGMNDQEQFSGSLSLPGGISHGFRFTPGVGYDDIGTLGGQNSFGFGIDDSGTVLASAQTASSPTTGFEEFGHAAIYNTELGLVDLNRYVDPTSSLVLVTTFRSAGNWISGTAIDGGINSAYRLNRSTGMVDDISVNNGGSLFGFGINSYGEVVGDGTIDGANQPSAAFIFTDALGLRKLNDLIDPSSGWNLTNALVIDDEGDVVGTGFLNGRFAAYILRLPLRPASGGAPTVAVAHSYGYDGLRTSTTNGPGTSGASVQFWFTQDYTQHDGVRDHYVRIGDRIVAKVTYNPPPGGTMGMGLVRRPGENPTDLGDLISKIILALMLAGGVSVSAAGFVGKKRRRPAWVVAVAGPVVLFFVASCEMLGLNERQSAQTLWQRVSTVYFHGGIGPGPVLTTNSDGSLREERRYEPFGQPIDSNVGGGGIGAVDFRREEQNSLGKLTDPATGWSYHGARWMQPQTARWTAPDRSTKTPMEAMRRAFLGLNPYAYAIQNPILYLDLNGEFEIESSALGWLAKMNDPSLATHEGIVNNALNDQFSPSAMQDVVRGNESVDAMENQGVSVEAEAKHAMRNEFQDPLDAMARTNNWVESTIQSTVDNIMSGHAAVARDWTGQGTHTIADSYAQAHRVDGVPQVWDPNDPISMAKHIKSDLAERVGTKNVNEATDATRDYFEEIKERFQSAAKEKGLSPEQAQKLWGDYTGMPGASPASSPAAASDTAGSTGVSASDATDLGFDAADLGL